MSESVQVVSGASLAELTTLRIGGPARRLVTAVDEGAAIAVVQEADRTSEPLLVLSGGSNVVLADEQFEGTAVRIATRGISVARDPSTLAAQEPVEVRVAAGEDWDALVARCVQWGLNGIEALAGIPGCVGSTPVQNVGAYGQEVADTITEVRVWDRGEQRERTLSAEECRFSYRNSIFKSSSMGISGRFLVLEVGFTLVRSELSRPVAYGSLAQGLGVELGTRVALGQVREAVLRQRSARGMVLDPQDHDTWSCGSFFTNPLLSSRQFADLCARVAEQAPDRGEPPRFEAGQGRVKTSAAWLIDRAGFTKGYGLPGPAALSTKHPLAVTNRGGATAADIRQLAREVRDGVEQRFGVHLDHEPVFVGHRL